MNRLLLPVALSSLAVGLGTGCSAKEEGPSEGPASAPTVPGVPPVSAQPVGQRLVVMLVPGMDPDLAERWRGDMPNLQRLALGRPLPRLAHDQPSDPVHVAAQVATGTVQGRSGVIGGPGFSADTMSWDSPEHTAQAFRHPPFWELAARGGVPTRALWVPGPVPESPPDGLWIMPEAVPSALPAGPVVILVGQAEPPEATGLGPVVKAEGAGPWTIEVPLSEQAAWNIELSQPRPDAYRLAVEGVRLDVSLDELSLPVAVPLPETAGGGFVLTRVSAVQRGDGVAISLVGAGRVPGVGGAVTTPAPFAEEWRRYHGEPDTTGGALGLVPAFEAGLISPGLLPPLLESEVAERGESLVEELARRDASLVVASFPQAGIAGMGFLGFSDPNHPAWDTDSAAVFGGVTKSLYVDIDKVIGRVKAALQPGDRLMIISGHGVGTARYYVDLNRALAKVGALSTSGAELPAVIGQDLPWKKVKAWSAGSGMVWVNSASRFEAGTTSGRAETRLRRDIDRGLRRLKHDGKEVVADIVAGDEVFAGLPEAERPDYLVVLADGFDVSPTSYSAAVGNEVVVVNHGPSTGGRGATAEDMRGFFVTSFGSTPGDAHAADIAPTVLTSLGVAGAEQLDGLVWTIGAPAAEDGSDAPQDQPAP